jgi:hypothetical protein
MAIKTIHSTHLDANDSVFFARELEATKARSYDVQYPELKARSLIPVSYEAGPGAATIRYEQYDRVGVAKIIASYASDLPRADVKGKEFISPIRPIGVSYGYSIYEIQAARMAGKPLEQRRSDAARRAYEEKVNRIGFFGDAEYGLHGLLTHPNIPAASVTADGNSNGGSSSTKWKHKTPDQILRDMNKLVLDMLEDTHGIERPDTMLLPDEQYGLIATTPRSSTSDTTILGFFLKTNPDIKAVIPASELKGAGPSGVDVALVYKRSPDKLTLEIPQDYEQLPPQEKGLEFVVNCHGRNGGVIVYYPLSISIGEGI